MTDKFLNGKTCAALLAEIVDVRAAWVAGDDDDAPDALFSAMAELCDAIDREYEPRFRAALPFLKEALDVIAALPREEWSESSPFWRAWQAFEARVDEYDRAARRRAEQRPPTVRELRREGVSDAQICAIYGLLRRSPTGEPIPDRDALNREISAQDDGASPSFPANEPPTRDSAIYRETTAGNLGGPPPEISSKKLNATDCSTSLKNEMDDLLENGVPVRQIAASLGVSVDEVKERASASNITPCEHASELSPRLRQACVAFLSENPDATYEEIAAACSTSVRPVSKEEAQKAVAAFCKANDAQKKLRARKKKDA